MSDLRELYQEMILEHNKQPRNFREIQDATARTEGFNPLCGDRLTVYLKIAGGRVKDVSFKGSGCAISKSSASMMTAAVMGRTVKEAEHLFQAFRDMLSSKKGAPFDAERLGKLAVFSGVNEYPARIKCATLAWHTLRAALDGGTDGSVSTE
ncbi:MAG: SUF system NifU family Fe-S cluster assembly protein [Candidatus Omnitrophica bacterium]|nr:SUF system NifU family Fe-S cluster assembly protein [Candidatus Omnitrophota bacterium]